MALCARSGDCPIRGIADLIQQRGKGKSRPISRVLSRATIHLGQMSPFASSNLPESRTGRARPSFDSLDSYLVLLRVGFSLPRLLPVVRCALTAPFHPYLTWFSVCETYLANRACRRYIFCGTFRRLTPPRRYLAPCPMEPGLSSPCITQGAIAWPTLWSILSEWPAKGH